MRGCVDEAGLSASGNDRTRGRDNSVCSAEEQGKEDKERWQTYSSRAGWEMVTSFCLFWILLTSWLRDVALGCGLHAASWIAVSLFSTYIPRISSSSDQSSVKWSIFYWINYVYHDIYCYRFITQPYTTYIFVSAFAPHSTHRHTYTLWYTLLRLLTHKHRVICLQRKPPSSQYD